ncbi:isochorismatase family protein [Hypoxylon sp. EC38]|nr:isochorismatase family protein [Hypoxylon sp. EC38]
MTQSAVSQVVVGSPSNFWLWSPDYGWDMTHPKTPEASPVQPNLVLNCEISNVIIDPRKTALLIIDMQNYSMSSALGVSHVPAVFQAQDALLKYAIPAARKANIQIIWLNWGLTEKDLEVITPGSMRVFGWRANCEAVDYGVFPRSWTTNGGEKMIKCGECPKAKGPGMDLGKVVLTNGTEVEAGRALMRDTWNAELHEPLRCAFEQGQTASRPDVLIHKDRNSGLYDGSCSLNQYLEKSGIRTLLFAGMNTDQCVMANLQDAHSRGFDTIMLRDACATDSPNYAQQSAEFNCCINWGFLSTSRSLSTAATSFNSTKGT